MDTKKRAIILDMDETLEHGSFKSNYIQNEEGTIMTLRPGLDELIEKLKVAKKQGIDIILCTAGRDYWAKRFLALKPEFMEIFNTIYTKDNNEVWNPTGCAQKPIERFGYDSLLFIDDNWAERSRLQELYDKKQLPLHIDITYFSGFFGGEGIDLSVLIRCKNASIQNSEVAQKLEQFLEAERNESGCNIMCSVIDTFMNKVFEPGFTVADEKYFAEYDEIRKLRESLQYELEDFSDEIGEQIGAGLIGYTDSELQELKEYLSTDKKYPYEGIEVARPEVDKREKLAGLIQKAKDTQEKLGVAQQFIADYDSTQQEEK